MKSRPDRASVHTQEWLWWHNFCDGAKLRLADLESGVTETRIGYIFCRYLGCCEHLFGA